MTQTQNGPQQQQQQRTDEVEEGRAAAIAQALLIVLALGMGGAGLVLPLDGGDPAEPISMLIVTEDATEGCPAMACCSPSAQTTTKTERSKRPKPTAARPSATVHEAPTAPRNERCNVRMTTSTVPSGETCPEGGLAYAWGLDLDANGTLDATRCWRPPSCATARKERTAPTGSPASTGRTEAMARTVKPGPRP